MTIPNPGYDGPPIPEPGHDAPTAVNPVFGRERLVTAPPAKTPGSGRVARRVLLTGGALALCGGAAALTPLAIDEARKFTEAQVAAAVAAAETNARLALLKELSNLEGIGIDVALEAAVVTQALVQKIVLPVITLLIAIGSGALSLLINAVTAARNALTFIPGSGAQQQMLQRLIDMLGAWRNGVASLPQDLTAYANADFTSAEGYLTALHQRIVAAQSETPVPTPTPRF